MKLYSIVFSPTGGTQKVATVLTDALEGEATRVDLTDSKQNFRTVQLTQEDVAIISVPSYGGRVPAVAVDRLTKLNGQGARAILVCVYGNRAYEDTLVELEDAAKQAGFRVIAAVAEHSIARQVQAKLSAGDSTEPSILRNRPYKKAERASPVCAVSPSALTPPGKSIPLCSLLPA